MRREKRDSRVCALAGLAILVLCAGPACRKNTSTRWSYAAENGRVSAAAVIDERIAFGTEVALHLVDRQGEKLCVQRDLGGVAATPAVSEERIWIVTLDAELVALDWTCAIQWRIRLPGRVTGGITRFDGALLVASHSGRLKSIDSTTGKLRWDYPPLNQPALRPLAQAAPLVAEGLVWVGRREGGVVAVDAKDGTVRFEAPIGTVTGGLLLRQGWIWGAEEEGRLFAVAADSGEIKRRIELGSALGSAPIAVDDLIVVGTRDREVLGVDAASGELRWRFATRGPIEVPPVVHASRIIAAGGSGDGSLYAIDPVSGEGESVFRGKARIASDLVVQSGVLFVTSESGVLYAFDAFPVAKR